MKGRAVKQQAQVCLGGAALPIGNVTFVRDGRREYSVFAYDDPWLAYRERFEVSPDLPLREGHVTRRAPTAEDSPFPFALADTEPDAWGKRVVDRAHARRRRHDPKLAPLTRFDYLAAVDDVSRVGALRLRDAAGTFLRPPEISPAPHFVDLDRIYVASRAVEQGTDTAADLRYLMGKATSLGGLRPKCTLRDEDGSLALAKFPSLGDMRSITRGEVLASKLAKRAGLDVAPARVAMIDDTPVAVIRRFDRAEGDTRIAYLSAGSLLQARRDEDRAYTELADTLRRISAQPVEDVRELWCRLLFNLLISNVDDHLWNMAVIYDGAGQWRLAPAFDLNPFPDRLRESKTWLSEESGPITSLQQLLDGAAWFGLDSADANEIAARQARVVGDWRAVATSQDVGLVEGELNAFEPAFEHLDARRARAIGGR